MKPGVICIKPRVLFGLMEEFYPEPQKISLAMPSSQIGSVTTLEASLLCSLLLIKKPRKIFEFGTFLGYTTSLFLMNSPQCATVFSLDLPTIESSNSSHLTELDWNKVKSDDAYNDAFLTSFSQSKGELYLTNHRNDPRLTLLKQDSRDLWQLMDKFERTFDFIFVDGGHSEEIASIDTNNGLQMLTDQGIMIWHDYNSKLHTSVTNVVNKFAEERSVVSIESTMLAFTIRDSEQFKLSFDSPQV